ncbi:MAG TPA: 16S rRNA (cytosine(1402)-N(4))-methyltransferase RsmH, partial [Acidimicrobiia bacterium]
MKGQFDHVPVMGREIVELLLPVPTGLVVDATVGGGGHAALLLRARPDIRLLGIDRDADAVSAARDRLAEFGDRVQVVQGRFGELREILSERDEGNVIAVLFDLGVSSAQLDRPERGFSYRFDAPLDMRMDSSQSLTAAEVVNEYDEGRLARVISRFGEERFANRVAAAIVAARPIH